MTPSTARSLPTTAASPHAAAPLFDALRAFVERGQAPFYSPGHKGGRTLDPWFRTHIAELDLNNLPDMASNAESVDYEKIFESDDVDDAED